MNPTAAYPLVLLLLLSGCAAEPSGPATLPTSEAPLEAPSPIVTEDTGSLVGRVVDQELVPIAGAEVGLLEPPGERVETALDGSFTLNALQPGPVVVAARASGHEQAITRLTIEPGIVTETVFTLAAIPVQVPYSETWDHAGYLELGLGTPVISPRPGPNNVLTWKRDIRDGLNASHSTMLWTRTAAYSASQLRLVIDTNGDNAFDAPGPSPLVARIGYDAVKAGFIRHDVLVPVTCACASNPPNGILDPVVAQRFTIYATAFYFAGAPDGFTNAPDA